MLEPNAAYEQAFSVADEMFAFVPEIFGCSIVALRELSYVDVLISVYDEIETVIPSPDRVFHRVSEQGARNLFFSAKEKPEVYEVIKEVCIRNLYNEDAPLPFMFRKFIIAELQGVFERKKRRGPLVSEGFAQKAYIFGTARYISDAFNLPLTRNESSPDTSSCDVLVDVAPRHGLDLKFTTVRDWCNHRNYRQMRAQATALENYLKDKYLIKNGILNPRILG